MRPGKFPVQFHASDSKLGFKFSGNSSRTDWCAGGGEGDKIIPAGDNESGKRARRPGMLVLM